MPFTAAISHIDPTFDSSSRVIQASTHLSGAEARLLSDRLATTPPQQDVILDLRATQKIGVTGLVSMLEAQSSLDARGLELSLLCDEGPVLQLLERLHIHLSITVLTDTSQIQGPVWNATRPELRKVA